MSHRAERQLEAKVKLAVFLLVLAALGIGGMQNFLRTLVIMVLSVGGLAVLGALVYFLVSNYRRKPKPHHGWAGMPPINPHEAFRSFPEAPVHTPPQQPSWTSTKIEDSLGEIDWYQFEKFCAALLRGDGYTVQRKGGAQPDGGVDLIATKGDVPMLVQCKHWRTWVVQERVIRELLGSMTHYQVQKGALYVLKGATRPAQSFAAQHNIQVDDGRALAERARHLLSDDELSLFLNSREHHCPKCESRMVWRTGDFTPFWGCSTFPRCRTTLKYSGAK